MLAFSVWKKPAGSVRYGALPVFPALLETFMTCADRWFMAAFCYHGYQYYGCQDKCEFLHTV